MKAKILMSDAAPAIHSGFIQTFGDDVLILMCWYHMKTCVVKKIKKYCPQKFHSKIVADLDQLQLSSSDDIFNKASKFFIEK